MRAWVLAVLFCYSACYCACYCVYNHAYECKAGREGGRTFIACPHMPFRASRIRVPKHMPQEVCARGSDQLACGGQGTHRPRQGARARAQHARLLARTHACTLHMRALGLAHATRAGSARSPPHMQAKPNETCRTRQRSARSLRPSTAHSPSCELGSTRHAHRSVFGDFRGMPTANAEG